MPRILYLNGQSDSPTGGNKVVFRHVEALNHLGYRAAVRVFGEMRPPTWFEHDAPIEASDGGFGPDDILVLPEDAAALMRACAELPNRKVVFCQNIYGLFAQGYGALPEALRSRYRTFLACNSGVAAAIARFADYELISIAPAFADERIFRPLPKEPLIACAPRKRPIEYATIRHMFGRLYRGSTDWRWVPLQKVSEAGVADAMGRASVFLSLARMEAHSLTTLEAMACGCLMAGFTGIGPREYLNPTNGLWVDEDDCEAAAQALVDACGMADAGGGAQALMRHAARHTAAQWSHAAFVLALESFWRDQMGVTPG